MPEVEEVFRIATQKVRPDPGALERQNRGQRRRATRRKVGVYALVATLGIVGGAVALDVGLLNDSGPATTRTSSAPASGLTPQDVVVVGLDGTILRQVPGLPIDAYELALSDDGRSIAFAASNGGVSQIGTIGIDGTGLRFLTSERYAATAPAWSPDGSRIAYTALDASGNRDIYVINADGSNVTRVTRTNVNNTYMKPQWSPDGSHVVYSVNPGAEFSSMEEIWTAPASGGAPTRLTHNGTSDTEPAWGGSPAGSQIAFAREG